MYGASRVAATAWNNRVCSVQCKVRQHVVEALLVEVDNFHVATFMIGMAAFAVESLRFRQPAMEAGFLCDVVANFCMTNDAKFALRLVRQRCVAGTAFCFDIRVAGDDGARHDQPLFDF